MTVELETVACLDALAEALDDLAGTLVGHLDRLHLRRYREIVHGHASAVRMAVDGLRAAVDLVGLLADLEAGTAVRCDCGAVLNAGDMAAHVTGHPAHT